MKKEDSLKDFFSPKTIAVVGASDNPKKVGYVLMEKLSEFKGKVIPINIKHKEIFGKKAYSSLSEYPKKIDLAIIVVPAKIVKQILEDCGKKQIKNVIIISAGFSEVKNNKLEQEIIQVGKKYRINLLGPNCFGIANPSLNLDTTFSNTPAKKGNIAFISQSGALWSYLSDISSSTKLGFSGFVSLGNMADLDFSDFINYFNKDKKTKKIILYVEKLKQGKRFIDICRKSKKEIIVVKAGKSEKGSMAAISHTGSLATDFEIYKGAFKQAQVNLVDSLSSAFRLKKSKIKIHFKTKGNKIVIITNAGGAGTLMIDYLVEKGFDVKQPIDLIGTALAKDYELALEKLKKAKFDGSIIVILTPQKMSEPEKTAKAIIKFAKDKSIIACFLGGNSVKKAKEILEKNNILCVDKLKDAAEILGI
ncbi:CoA-binding protein [Candidatus Pacearchaeota archaeon]|nr:CoA-binding protein [Candidatus Pacearchaeota archaeon]